MSSGAAVEGTERDSGGLLARIVQLALPSELNEPFAGEPTGILREWLRDAEASGAYPEAGAMVLATASAEGAPSARVVICKQIEARPASLLFFTSYESRKGRELRANPRAAGVFYWPHAKRQARVEGRVEVIPAEESDRYFEQRPLLSRLGAVASKQSQPLRAREELVRAITAEGTRYLLRGGVERPRTWGGYRLLFERVELWTGREGRLHDRVQWSRGENGWDAKRLSP